MSVLCRIVVIFIFFNESSCFEKIDRPDTGEPCEWEGVRGTCVNYWTCLSNAVDAVNGVYPPVCSTNGDEVRTCCTGCDVVANISALSIVTDYQTFEIPTLKSRKKCIEYMRHFTYPCIENINVTLFKAYVVMQACHIYGWSIEPKRGVNYDEARRQHVYYNVAQLGYGRYWESAEWLCGGTIISDRYILTAAHCGHSDRLGAVKYVAVGVANRSEPMDSWQVHGVASFIPHPDYRSTSKYHDIALLKTSRRISFSRTVLPACLPEADESWYIGFPTVWRNGTITQMDMVFQYSDEDCMEYFPPSDVLHRGYDNKTQACYGNRVKGIDFKQGDDGAPLQTLWCPACVLGVTSSDSSTPGPGTPGLYTRVIYYVSWIESVVWPDDFIY